MSEHLRRPADATPSDVNCGDPIAALEAMFVEMVMGRRIGGGQSPVLRPVFLKPHGIVSATFTPRSGLPGSMRVGVFAGAGYPAWVRFSSDTVPTAPDLMTTCGVGIKLFGVPGPKLLEPDAVTHDFLLQNFEVFFVDTAADFCEFTRAGVVGGDYAPYLAAHPKTARLLEEMAKRVPSVLETPYWSGLPYRFGADRYVKYMLIPAGDRGTAVPGLSADDPDYLRKDLRGRLLESPAEFHFMVQFRTEPERMPLDAATIRWEETASPPVHVATLTLGRQDVDAPGQAEYGENLAYNPWHALAEHAPVGSLADARKIVYQAAANRRRTQNGVPLAEPDEPRPSPEPDDRRIVRAAIHPSIGIARVGNSPDHFFIGPEVDEPAPVDSYKDASGALKRQAARFRIYGYNAAGEAVAELTAQNADVVWTTHLANTKAAWYQFQIALDIPEARDAATPPSLLRNLNVIGDERAQLAIDPGARTIRGGSRAGPEYRFDTGTFFGKAVYLGELRTDEAGRLLVLGGHGHSAPAADQPLTDFANNDGWHDDASDGPVTATVRIDGRAIPVDPSWVVIAPPNYAPAVRTVRTLYDLLFDCFVQSGALAFPERTSFMRHVYPILARMSGLQWVNQGFATAFGWGGRERFDDRGYLEQVASPAAEYSELRQQILTTFRDWDRDGKSPVPWPWIYGDSMSLPPISARQQMQLSGTQMRLLERWAAGDFDSDLDLGREPPRAIEDVAVAEQPETLDRAALTHCLADAFHPGCELTWPIRHASMYMAPFRIRHRAIGDPEPSPAKRLTPLAALAVDGPLYGQSPGSLSRWMAVPWQADTSSCRSGYDSRYDPYLPTFWPARVPNQVLTERDYKITVDEGRPLGERRAAFARRANWLRWLTPKVPQYMLDMVEHFGKFGVVETRPGPSDGAFPARLLVESEVGFTEDVHPRRGLHVVHVPDARDEDVAEVAINSAIEASPHPNEEIIAGYFSKAARFHR